MWKALAPMWYFSAMPRSSSSAAASLRHCSLWTVTAHLRRSRADKGKQTGCSGRLHGEQAPAGVKEVGATTTRRTAQVQRLPERESRRCRRQEDPEARGWSLGHLIGRMNGEDPSARVAKRCGVA